MFVVIQTNYHRYTFYFIFHVLFHLSLLKTRRYLYRRVYALAQTANEVFQLAQSVLVVDIVVRTGGSSLVPVFEKMLVDLFGKDKVTEFDPFTSVAAGLAVG